MTDTLTWSAGAGAFRRLVDAAPDAMLVVDPAGVIVYANAQAERMFLRSQAALIGLAVEALLPETARAGHVARRVAFHAAPQTRPMGSGRELFARRADGQEFPVEISLSPLELEEGRFVCAGVRDISERHQSQLALSRLAAIVDSSEDAIFGMDPGGRITSWNAAAARIFGYEAAEVLGRPAALLVPGERVHEREQLLERCRAGEHVAPFDTVRLRKDGRPLDVSISVSPIRDGRGQLVGASKIVRDVSERTRMEAAARQTSQHLANAVESFQGALGLFDADDRLVICNSTFRQLFGHTLTGGLLGRRFVEFVDADLAAGTFVFGDEPQEVSRARALAYHADPRGAYELRLADGRTIRCVDRRTSDGGTVSTAWDITDDARQKTELQVARAAAESASAAKSEFLASMSHELRTPLNAVLGFAQLLQRDRKSPLTERQLERLGHVVKGGEHLLRLIDEVLDLSRIESGRLPISVEPVDVARVLAEVQATLGPLAARAEIDLRIGDVPRDLPEVLADRIRFRQVLMNFGSNAIKYGHAGGDARLSAALRGDRVRIEVRDDGAGIPLDKQDKIFQPFFRAGQETGPIEGTGIGLAITRRLAEVMHGSVGFTSAPGRGSTFWTELPACAAPAREPEAQRSARVDASPLGEPGPRRLIVYVEDNPPNIAFMEAFLADFERIALLTAPTAEIGIELARARRPDLIIMDINLPGMSGFEAVAQLRRWPETRDTPIVGLSAAAMVRDHKRVEEAGFVRYLTKPVDVDELTAVLEQVLDRG